MASHQSIDKPKIPCCEQTLQLYPLWNQSNCRSMAGKAAIGNFVFFCSCDVDLDRMTFIYAPDPYSLKMYSQTINELSMSRLSRVIILHTYRPMDRCDRNYHHAASGVVKARSHRPCDQVATYVRLVEQPNRRGSQIDRATAVS